MRQQIFRPGRPSRASIAAGKVGSIAFIAAACCLFPAAIGNAQGDKQSEKKAVKQPLNLFGDKSGKSGDAAQKSADKPRMNIFGGRPKISDKPDAEKSNAPAQSLETIENSIGMKLVKIPAGKFLMGSPESEKERMLGEAQHEVTIDKPFYIGAYEVTQAEYKAVLDENPSVSQGEKLPVDSVNWDEAMNFCRALSQKEKQTYRLPTEAEWEYACRAGTTTPFSHGNSLTFMQANFNTYFPYGVDFKGRTLDATKPVGSYRPNPWGLYDMHGNVMEWCLDVLTGTTQLHIQRGGGGGLAGKWCRSAQRWSASGKWQWYGFRVVRTVEPVHGEINIPVAPPLDRVDKFTTAQLAAKIDEALARPAADLLPPVVIFPVVDANRKVRNDGVGLSYLAGYQTAFTPKRRMNVSLQYAIESLKNASCLKPGVELDDTSLAICLAAIGADRFVLPQLTENEGKLTLNWQIRARQELKPNVPSDSVPKKPADGAKSNPPTLPEKGPDASKKDVSPPPGPPHTDTPAQVADVPGLIARGVLADLGAQLSEAETKYVTTQQVALAEDFVRLGKFAGMWAFGTENAELIGFLDRNPRCVGGWMLYVYQSNPAEAALKRFANIKPPLECDDLTIARLVRSNPSQDNLLELLSLAPASRTDCFFLRSLTYISRSLRDDGLTEHVFEAWRKVDSSYASCTERGECFDAWGWDARGGGWASEVTRKGWQLFGKRLTQAKKDLERAIEINPLGFEAHSKLITVGMAMSAPDDYVAEHFDRAVDLRPYFSNAYANRFRSVMPRWGGDKDSILAFARRCFETPYTRDERVPNWGFKAIDELGSDPAENAGVRSIFQDPDVWETVRIFYENGQNSGDPEQEAFTRQYYAKFGAYGGHYDDVAEAYERLDQDGTTESIFWDYYNYPFLRDLVRSHTASGPQKTAAALKTALAMGNFDEAAQWVAELNDGSDESTKLAEKSQQIIELGRTLTDKKELKFTSQDILKYFDGVDANWRNQGDRLVCQLQPHKITVLVLPFGVANVEVNVQLGWTDRNAQIQIHSHVRNLRDDVWVRYLPGESNVHLMRRRASVQYAQFSETQTTCRMVLTSQGDQIEPSKNIHWNAGAFEPTPGAIAIEVATANDRATVWVKSITIKQLDEPKPEGGDNK